MQKNDLRAGKCESDDMKMIIMKDCSNIRQIEAIVARI